MGSAQAMDMPAKGPGVAAVQVAPQSAQSADPAFCGLFADLWGHHILPHVVSKEELHKALPYLLALRRISRGFKALLHKGTTFNACLCLTTLPDELGKRALVVQYLKKYLVSILSKNTVPSEIDRAFLTTVLTGTWEWRILSAQVFKKVSCQSSDIKGSSCGDAVSLLPHKTCIVFWLSGVNDGNDMNLVDILSLMQPNDKEYFFDFFKQLLHESERDGFYAKNHNPALSALRLLVLTSQSSQEEAPDFSQELSYDKIFTQIIVKNSGLTSKRILSVLVEHNIPESYLRILRGVQENNEGAVEKLVNVRNKGETVSVLADLAFILAVLRGHIELAKKILTMGVITKRDERCLPFIGVFLGLVENAKDDDLCFEFGFHFVSSYKEMDGTNIKTETLGNIVVQFAFLALLPGSYGRTAAVLLIAGGMHGVVIPDRNDWIVLFCKGCFEEDLEIVELLGQRGMLSDSTRKILFHGLIPILVIKRSYKVLAFLLNKDEKELEEVRNNMVHEISSLFGFSIEDVGNEEFHSSLRQQGIKAMIMGDEK